jgi:Na+/proline symporter
LSFELAVKYGLYGFLAFFIPNFLTLMVYGKVSVKIRRELNGYTIGDIVKQRSGKSHYYCNILATTSLLILSTTAQLTGLVFVLSQYTTLSNIQISMLISALCFLYTFRHGLKSSILTDCAKYVIMLVCGASMLLLFTKGVDFKIIDPADFSTKAMWFDFGITTVINLSVAIYPDQTFWQRTFSLDPKRVTRSYYAGGLLFALIPLIFGTMGLISYANGNTIANAGQFFTAFPFNIMFLVLVLCALIATLDSNLCAISSLAWNEFNLSDKRGKIWGVLAMLILLILANSIYYLGLPLLFLFLVYGTVRTSVGLGIVLMIFDRFNKRRLFIATLVSLLVFVPSFVYFKTVNNPYSWIVTVVILLMPLLGWSKKRVAE